MTNLALSKVIQQGDVEETIKRTKQLEECVKLGSYDGLKGQPMCLRRRALNQGVLPAYGSQVLIISKSVQVQVIQRTMERSIFGVPIIDKEPKQLEDELK